MSVVGYSGSTWSGETMIPHIRTGGRQTSKSNRNERSGEAAAGREARVATDARVLRPGKVVIGTITLISDWRPLTTDHLHHSPSTDQRASDEAPIMLAPLVQHPEP